MPHPFGEIWGTHLAEEDFNGIKLGLITSRNGGLEKDWAVDVSDG